MGDTAWKKAERQIAKKFQTERCGPLGDFCPDAISESYAIEVKNRTHLPNWLQDALDQAQRNGGKYAPDHLPIVVLHEKGQWYDHCIVMVRLKEFIEWFGV